jgi:hypothetical protein
MENLDHISRVVTTLDSSKEISGQYMENLDHLSRVSILSYWEWKKNSIKLGMSLSNYQTIWGFPKSSINDVLHLP